MVRRPHGRRAMASSGVAVDRVSGKSHFLKLLECRGLHAHRIALLVEIVDKNVLGYEVVVADFGGLGQASGSCYKSAFTLQWYDLEHDLPLLKNLPAVVALLRVTSSQPFRSPKPWSKRVRQLLKPSGTVCPGRLSKMRIFSLERPISLAATRTFCRISGSTMKKRMLAALAA